MSRARAVSAGIVVFVVASAAANHSNAESAQQSTTEAAPPEPAAAAQEDNSEIRYVAALRSGFGFPFGKAAGSDSTGLRDTLAGQIPIWADIGLGIGAWTFTLYASYGVGVVGSGFRDACELMHARSDVSVTCSASDVRVGLDVTYAFRSRSMAVPWLGGGFGWEWMNLSETLAPGGESAVLGYTANGVEALNLQSGVDFALSEAVSLGAFVSLGSGIYLNESSDCTGDPCLVSGGSNSIADRALHEWLMLGVRQTVSL